VFVLFYWIFKATALYSLRLWFRPTVEGLENVPPGAVILASNHLSFLDSLLFGAVLSRRITFLAKSSYFNRPGIQGRLVGWFFRALGQVPIDRSGGSAGDGALRSGLTVLRQGGVLGIYPEGTRSPDGRLYRGRTGVARLALTTGAAVLPVGITGTDVAQPPGTVTLRRAPLRMVIGAPLDFSAMAEGRASQVRRRVTDHIVQNIQHLSGQQYVDKYSPGPMIA
jgi:1-acyl-sn-glycerol-3-phosphate acyltransferase